MARFHTSFVWSAGGSERHKHHVLGTSEIAEREQCSIFPIIMNISLHV